MHRGRTYIFAPRSPPTCCLFRTHWTPHPTSPERDFCRPLEESGRRFFFFFSSIQLTGRQVAVSGGIGGPLSRHLGGQPPHRSQTRPAEGFASSFSALFGFRGNRPTTWRQEERSDRRRTRPRGRETPRRPPLRLRLLLPLPPLRPRSCSSRSSSSCRRSYRHSCRPPPRGDSRRTSRQNRSRRVHVGLRSICCLLDLDLVLVPPVLSLLAESSPDRRLSLIFAPLSHALPRTLP